MEYNTANYYRILHSIPIKYPVSKPCLSNLHLKFNLKKSHRRCPITSCTAQDDTKKTDTETSNSTTSKDKEEEPAITSIKQEEKAQLKRIQQRQKPRRLSSIYQVYFN